MLREPASESTPPITPAALELLLSRCRNRFGEFGHKPGSQRARDAITRAVMHTEERAWVDASLFYVMWEGGNFAGRFTLKRCVHAFSDWDSAAGKRPTPAQIVSALLVMLS